MAKHTPPNEAGSNAKGEAASASAPTSKEFHLPLDWSTEVAGHTLTVHDLTPANIGRLLANGYIQYISDAAALAKSTKVDHPAQVGEDGKAVKVEFGSLSEEEQEAYKAAKRAAKHAAILAGDFPTRGSGTATAPRTIDDFHRSLLLASAKALLKAKQAEAKAQKLEPVEFDFKDESRTSALLAKIAAAKPELRVQAEAEYQASLDRKATVAVAAKDLGDLFS